MQYSITLNLSGHTTQLLQNQHPANTSVYHDLLQHADKLQSLLISYHFKSRERVFNVMIEESSVSVNPDGKGGFTLHYSIGMFNACADLDHTDRVKMQIGIAVNDFSTGETTLNGEYIPEREPDEI